ncbi:MAG TPA: hypothetical protein VLQ80_15580 [Candidatus Saccharimonadia bacterium]|nr:hypothetical protein [Candidatus Saccharimonadia bacterium]
MISRHSSRTVPAMCRPRCSQNAAELVQAWRQCGARCLDGLSREGQGKALTGGDMTGIPPHGRHGPYPPHVPLIATRGGDDGGAQRGEPVRCLPYDRWHRHGPWPLMDAVRKTRATDEMKRRGDEWCRRYRPGLVATGPTGRVPAQSHR